MALAMGVFYPQFETENAAQIPTSFGGLLFMMASVTLLGAIIAAEAAPVATYLRARQAGEELGMTKELVVAFGVRVHAVHGGDRGVDPDGAGAAPRDGGLGSALSRRLLHHLVVTRRVAEAEPADEVVPALLGLVVAVGVAQVGDHQHVEVLVRLDQRVDHPERHRRDGRCCPCRP